MGAETHVHLRTLENTLIARIPGNVIPEVGEKMMMHLDTQHLHFFDAETGRLLP
jgi:ABC-type sugar transport system ATPase subunit